MVREELEDFELIERELRNFKRVNPMALECRLLDLIDWFVFTEKSYDETQKTTELFDFVTTNIKKINKIIDPDFFDQYPEAKKLLQKTIKAA